MQNYVFVVFQSEATKNNSHDYLISHAKETFVMKVLMQFRTNVSNMAIISDCLIEIYNTHTITFGYQTHFFSHFTFKLHSAWNSFDCLLWIKRTGVRMVNIKRRVASVNIAFISSRNAALIERKVLQCTTLSIKLHLCTLSERKTQVFTLSDVLACASIHCADQKQHSNPEFLTKSIDNTLQKCVDIANEYLQAKNAGADVKSHVFCSLYQCKCAGYTMFLIIFVISN